MQFVDTNIFIRFLTNDEPVKAKKCFELFEQARLGKIKLQTTETVIAEIVYILSSKKLYALNQSEISDKIIPIIRIRGIRIPDKSLIVKALQILAEYRLDFEDCILISHMWKKKSKDIYSYDRGFDKISSIKRLEP
ncbi:hypothetical protein A3D00_00440 [Candidatus Woesebacteria bacterium RIFCSPHIGHO2_02_FULL_38_9]|uniref:PIN domain-containing protein n=1 Tax=Candidatus Woesebacteria bacterium RIFCSPHIGHO2_01_FULL_39_28 TaxID=1802496 RepID=A0A1F7YLE6_9BACT|nr:MAG: hypothetical protein A2627_04690 [Candidatus Woesebacteria bacterium RIFCSPHIGHO2_01_FULL_39_28]OGM33199.1 MAG: hypothetical protein A3D00_00440 [Candidatus Woesebacteria bacterium RIFCSPHIGHO2_02_FULL_38_9]OGM57088.1 MAG: hypothetical protein A3A50_05495 [Candidatus Woesebacteria bacterium RIFCSPLOWO2_01_FULL_38_20]